MISGGGNGRNRLLALTAGLIVLAGAAAHFATRSAWNPPVDPGRIASAHLRDVAILAPATPPLGLAAIVSGRAGTGESERTFGQSLRERGFIVLQLDTPTWRAALDRDGAVCMRPIVDVELLAKEAQRALGVERYLRPILVGFDAGGALTAAILSRALPATLGGGIAIEPDPAFTSAAPICDDGAPVAEAVPAPEGGFAYPLPARMQAALTVVSAREASPEPRLPGYGSHLVAHRVEARRAERLSTAVDAAVTIATQDAGAGGLPVVDLPAQGPPRALALFVSGDGGWRDIDKRIGEQLTQDGIHVVGLDALRYFWSEREPKAVAGDLARILGEADPGRSLPVLVLGYSFGADLLPFAWPYWPATLRDRTKLIALLGPNRSTGFGVTVAGWLGLGGQHAVVPRIAELPLDRVLCLHGSQEAASACTDPSLSAARSVQLDGGHHFDRDYPAIARLILKEAGLPPQVGN